MNEEEKCYGQRLQEECSRVNREMGLAVLILGAFFLLICSGAVLYGVVSGPASASDAAVAMIGIAMYCSPLVWCGWDMWKG